jgi:ribosomal protein L29
LSRNPLNISYNFLSKDQICPTMAPSAKDLSARLEELEEELQSLAQAASQDEDGREKLLKTLRKSVAQVETPWEVVSRMYMEVNEPLSNANVSTHKLIVAHIIALPSCGHESIPRDGVGGSCCAWDQDLSRTG